MTAPLDWIKLELVPLPAAQDVQPLMLWWNPEARQLEGQGKELILDLISSALEKGHIQTGHGSHLAVTDPLNKPSELAAVLAQFYWVIPHPVAAPGDEPDERDNSSLLN